MTDQQTIYQSQPCWLSCLKSIRRTSNLKRDWYEDLELDSIDAVDMIVHLQKKTGKKISFKSLKQCVQSRMLSRL